MVRDRVDSVKKNSQKNHRKWPVKRFDLGIDTDFFT